MRIACLAGTPYLFTLYPELRELVTMVSLSATLHGYLNRDVGVGENSIVLIGQPNTVAGVQVGRDYTSLPFD